jgi:hypothetical protein
MIYSLATVPKIFDQQELSAQDLNNLAQNAEILDQYVHGPDRLFLSNWRLAPPVFTLINQKFEQGDPNTFIGYQQSMRIDDVDVWEGAFIYREGMHTLRLGFNTYPIAEKGNTKYYYGVDLSNIKSNYFNRDFKKTNADFVNESTSLFLRIKFTDVPLKLLLRDHKKFARSWVYATGKKAVYKQPHDDTRPSYTFVENSGSYVDEKWVAASTGGLTPIGYHKYELDITKFNFVPGEIVNLKFTIATRDGNPVKNWGRHFYFSMVYANIEQGILNPEVKGDPWITINEEDITSISKVDDIANNQRLIVEYLNQCDIPLRAALWDQVMAGGSITPFYARYDVIAFQNLAGWGFNEGDDYRYRNTHVAEAKYYLPKAFDLKNTISISYNVQVNTKTAFSMQCQLSKSAIAAGLIYKSRDADDSYVDPAFIYSNRDLPQEDNEPVMKYPHEVPLGRMNYKDEHFTAEQQALGTILSRIGKVNFMGTYTVVDAGVTKTISTNLLPEGITSVPEGYPETREFLYSRGALISTDEKNWHGFYFIRPSRIGDGGVPYYSAFGTTIKGLEQNMFLGPTAAKGEERDAAYYVDEFNFVLRPQAGNANRYYPAMYHTYGGLGAHSTYFIEKDSEIYTDFTINVKESSNSWSSNVGMFVTPSGKYKEIFSTSAFNKSSYISTLRIAEVARKDSATVRVPLGRFESFQEVSIEDIIGFLIDVNAKQNLVYELLTTDPAYKYIPVFWSKPKSSLARFEQLVYGDDAEKTFYKQMEMNTLYFSSTRQADYLIVRGRNISIGWNGFTRIYRDNPKNNIFPSPLDFTFAESQGLTGADIETTVIGFDTLEGLNYGQRYYIQGEVYYAAETMGVP